MDTNDISGRLREIIATILQTELRIFAQGLHELAGAEIECELVPVGERPPVVAGMIVRVTSRWPDDAPLKLITFRRPVDRLASYLDCDIVKVDERALVSQAISGVGYAISTASVLETLIHHLRPNEQGSAFCLDLMMKAAAIKLFPGDRQHAAELGAELELDFSTTTS
jgi:hypothetical protein